jgi:DNA mismatch endonuclease (patch repair protein)
MIINSKKAPRYNSFKPASASASYSKRRNKPKNTSPEMMLRKALWSRGLRYRLHASQLPGKPDIMFVKAHVVIFIDGDFWHGRDWSNLEKKLRHRANADYWIPKIKYNIDRDQEQTLALIKQGWEVLRFWELDIINNVEEIVAIVLKTLKRQGQVPVSLIPGSQGEQSH